MAQKRIDKYVMQDLMGPFETYCDDIDDLKERYENENEKGVDNYEKLVEELEQKEEMKLDEKHEELTEEEINAGYKKIEELTGKLWEQEEKKHEEKMKELWWKLLNEAVTRFMYYQGYDELEQGEIDYLMDMWSSVFDIDK